MSDSGDNDETTVNYAVTLTIREPVMLANGKGPSTRSKVSTNIKELNHFICTKDNYLSFLKAILDRFDLKQYIIDAAHTFKFKYYIKKCVGFSQHSLLSTNLSTYVLGRVMLLTSMIMQNMSRWSRRSYRMN
jgi:hypothetical protein